MPLFTAIRYNVPNFGTRSVTTVSNASLAVCLWRQGAPRKANGGHIPENAMI